MKLKEIMAELHSYINLDSAQEIKKVIELIIETQDLSPCEREVIQCCHKHGPLFDGDIPSKTSRDSLIEKGFITKVVVKGEDGFNACTQSGHFANKLIKIGICNLS